MTSFLAMRSEKCPVISLLKNCLYGFCLCEKQMQLMWSVKTLLDSKGILNPYKVLPTPVEKKTREVAKVL